MKQETFIRLCPNCGSARFKEENNIGIITGVPPSIVCEECNFSAKVFPEVNVEKIKDFKNGLKHKQFKKEVKEKVIKPLSFILWPIGFILGAVALFFFGAIILVVIIVIVILALLFGRKRMFVYRK